ncbi:MAG: hypothetical protein HYV09_39795 [Deltaproteobacteria bacterium]|nr:hypothetical protein [Deltaproteobacteria bacterium]
MDTLASGHLLALGAWGALVMVEGFVELGARDDDALRRAARTHFLLDVWIELPLLAAVLATGVALALRVPSWTALHSTKVAAGLVAVAANLYCVVIVMRRHATRDRVDALRRDSVRIRLVSPALGLPAAAIAAWIGFVHFLR